VIANPSDTPGGGAAGAASAAGCCWACLGCLVRLLPAAGPLALGLAGALPGRADGATEVGDGMSPSVFG
jgi:hypothetical protein